MRITINQQLTSLLLGALLIIGCHKDQENNKILNILPVNASVVSVPAYSAQEYLVLKQAAVQTIVPIVNRIGLTNQTFSELTGPNGSQQYSFQKSGNRYGTANFLIQFRDASNSVIDPIQTQSSTSSLKSVVIDVSGTSPRFTYTESLVLTLEIAGDADSIKRLTGTSSFAQTSNIIGSSYNMAYTITAGLKSSFDGLSAGSFEASGAGGPSNTASSLQMSLSSNQDANGSISWEDQTGGFHLEADGSGFITTEQYLIPIP